MKPVVALPEAVPVRYAREQYARGYLYGQQDVSGEADADDFARFYVARCEKSGRLVDVRAAYRSWLEVAKSTQLALFTD